MELLSVEMVTKEVLVMKRTNDSLRIAENIKRVRLDNHLTQLEMAMMLGYTERTIRRLETNGTDNISVINLIAEKFGVTALSILFN